MIFYKKNKSIDNKSKILIEFFLVILIVNCFLQSSAQVANFIPPSPNAASLAQHVNIPVSEYTGVPNINIPIYTIKAGDITLPITLNYHASGIKVEQEASWVGLGWSLSAGGVITRQIRGLDDFGAFGYINQPELPLSIEGNIIHAMDDENAYPMGICMGNIDGEPDIFYYNFNGRSGKLMFEKDQENSPTCFLQNNIKFQRDGDLWEVTDEKGVKYFFGTLEKTKNWFYIGSSWFYPTICNEINDQTYKTTAWYLDSIKSPTGDAIRFVYDNIWNNTISQVQRSEEKKQTLSYMSAAILFNITQRDIHTASMQEVDDVYLKEIVFKNGKIVFNTEDRLDIASKTAEKPQRLKNIQIYTSNDSLIKTFDFSHSYFNQSSGATDMMRLKLNELREIAKNDSLPPFEFTYNTTALPSKTSQSIDHWGYYNGKNNELIRNYKYEEVISNIGNQSFVEIGTETGLTDTLRTRIPYIEYDTGSKHVYFSGINRQPDSENMKASSLTKIKYPTKGTTEFEFEPNRYNQTNYSAYYMVQKDTIYKSSVTYTPNGYDPEDRVDTIQFSQTTMLKLDYYYEDTDFGILGTQLSTIAAILETNGDTILKFRPDPTKEIFETHISICLPAGEYIFVLDCPVDNTDSQDLYITYNKNISDIENEICGGLRVKGVINKEENGDVTSIKKYDYTLNNKSTGELMSPVQYIYNELMLLTLDLFGATDFSTISEQVLVRSSSSCFPFSSSAQGSHIGYNRVSITNESSNRSNAGKIVKYFHNTYDDSRTAFNPGIPSIVSNDNGYLWKTEEFNANGDTVRISYLRYLNISNNKKIIKGMKSYGRSLVGMSFDTYSIFYDNILEWWHPNSKDIYTYDAFGNIIHVKEDYIYNNSFHKLITRKSTIDSNGDTIKTYISYPPDITTGLVYQTMADSTINMLNYPIETITYKNNEITGSSLTTYKDDEGNYVPDKTYMLEITDPTSDIDQFNGTTKDENYGSSPEVEFIDYNSQGKLTKALGKDGQYLYFLWAYNNQYPVAKIVSTDSIPGVLALQSNVDNISFRCSDEIFDISTDIGELKSALSSALSSNDCMVTYYTYKPLVGMTSQTDPNEKTTYYEYDDFGRLKTVRDDDQKILKQYDYHYVSQEIDQTSSETEPGLKSTTILETYQAEDAVSISANNTVTDENAGFTGAGYVDYGYSQDWVEWDNVVGYGDTAKVILRYANGSSERPCELKVNGAVKGSIQFPNTGGWTTWEEDSISVVLDEGNNTIRVEAVESGPNIDKMEISSISSNPANYTLTVTELYLNDATSSNSGSVSLDSQQYPEGTTATLENEFPNNGGDHFHGYTLNSDGTAPSMSLNVTVNQDTTVYAVYDYTAPTSLLSGLIAAYEFEETSGSIFEDSSPNSLDGTISGVLINQEGKLGSGYSFDGVDDYVELPDSDLLEWGSSVTISAWIKTTTDGRWQAITQRETVYGQSINAFSFNSDLNVLFWESTSNSERLWSTSPIILNQWCHVVAILDGTSRKIYINGSLVGSDNNGVSADVIVNDNFHLGSTISDISRDRFKGYMDCFYIWSRALTEQEVQDLYNSGTGNSYPFDGSTAGGTAANYTLTVTESYLNDASSNNPGSVSPDNQIYQDGTSVDVTNDFSNTGDHFSGFFWDSNGTNPVSSFNITQDTTVYAVYDYTAPASASLLSGLVSCWEFDETTGTTLTDQHGNNDGSNNGVTINQTGAISQSYDFESDNSGYITIPNSDFSFSSANSFSISAWIKFESLPAGSIFSKMDYHLGWPNYVGYRIWTESDGDVTFGMMSDAGYYSGGGLYARANTNLSTGIWYHVVVTYDGSKSLDGIHTYVNTLNQSWQSSRDDLSSGSILNSKDVAIGANDGGGTSFFDGLIDQVGVWNRTLTEQEVSELYNTGNGKAYPFDGSTAGGTAANYTLAVTESYLNDAAGNNPGSVSPDNQTYQDGTSVDVTNDFTNTGDHFSGFFWDSDGTNPVSSFSISQDTTVYAVYDYTAPVSTSLLSGLISCWEFDETSGTILTDSKSDNHGTNNGAAINQAGKIGTAYSFDGNDYGAVSYDASLTPENFSVSVWVNLGNYTGNLEGVFVGAGGNGWSNGYRINRYETLVQFHWGYISSSSETLSFGNLTVGNWAHLTATHDGTTTKIYLNGVFVNESSDAFSYAIENPNWNELEIARGGGLNNFSGKIDQTAIWDRALTQQEISELYNSGSGKAYPFSSN